MKHAYTGIKAARVVESLNKTYGLDVLDVFDCHKINLLQLRRSRHQSNGD